VVSETSPFISGDVDPFDAVSPYSLESGRIKERLLFETFSFC